MLHLLANSPQTAKFISTKLAVRFVSDNPPQAMVDRMAATFLETKGDIRRVLLAMVNSPEFFTQDIYRVKVKTPQEYVVSAVRAAGSQVESTAALASAIADLGMPLYGHQTPDGLLDEGGPVEQHGGAGVADELCPGAFDQPRGGRDDGFRCPAGSGSRSAGPIQMTAEQKDVALEKALLHVPVSPRTQQLIVAQTSTDQAQQTKDLRQVSAVQGKRNPLTVRGARQKQQDIATMDTQAAMASGLILVRRSFSGGNFGVAFSGAARAS